MLSITNYLMQRHTCWAENTNPCKFVIALRHGVTTKEMDKA